MRYLKGHWLGCILVAAGVVASWLATAPAAGQTVCCGPTGVLWTCTPGDATCRSPIGFQCEGTGTIKPAGSCASAPPTPTATPTATPTPTAPPMPAPTIATVKLSLSIPWTYTGGLTLYRGVLWGHAGNPTSGQNNGECIFSVDYTRTPPPFRVWACTGHTADSLESAYPKVTDDPANGIGALRVVWIETRSVPPWGQTSGVPLRYGTITSLVARPVAGQAGALAVDDPAPYIARDTIAESETWLWPLGWLNVGGQRQLYVAHVTALWPTCIACMTRYYWHQHGGVWMDSQAFQPASYPMASVSDIAIDADGSLIATETTGDNATSMSIWRSRDEGKTWSIATTVQAAPGGSLFDCHFSHHAGGAADVPWLLTCNSTPPTGSWANGGWSVVSVAWPGAQFPTYWGKAPIKSPLSVGPAQMRAVVTPTVPIGPAPLSQLDVLKQLGIRKP